MTFSFRDSFPRSQVPERHGRELRKERWRTYLIFMRLGARISAMDEDGDGEDSGGGLWEAGKVREKDVLENIIFVPSREETSQGRAREPGSVGWRLRPLWEEEGGAGRTAWRWWGFAFR